MAKANPIRFSTKYQDDESDMLYYGYRYYKASTGTWVSRDPAKERGGKNLYAFLNNSPLARFDRLGLRGSDGGGCNPITGCCDTLTTLNGFRTLLERFSTAANYLHAHNVLTDPDSVNGVSCIFSANQILKFMSPIPKCWKCYIQTRTSAFDFWNENSIRCEPILANSFSSYVFDWWYEEAHNWNALYGMPYLPFNAEYYDKAMYPEVLPTDANAWPHPYEPAPHDTCTTASSFKPEQYAWLDALLPPYATGK